MKKQYIRQIRKDLHIPRSAKTEVVRDLQEIFASAAEHGESEQQVAERLGTPREFADRTAAFALYAAAAAQRVLPGAIGQADAMTNIRVEGAGFDVTLLLLAAGVLAAAFAILQLIRAARSGRRAA